MTYVVLKGYLYDPIDCIRPAVAIERGKYTEKTVLFNFDYLYISSFLFLDIYFYILVLVSSTIKISIQPPGSVSSFFRDELSAPVLHFFLYGPRRKGAQQEEDCTMREAQRSTRFKYGTWILAMQRSWVLISIRMNQSFYRGQSLPIRQEDSKF
ncbi:hypothetical protein VPH35_014461 [Triticum aestivum]